MSLQEPVGNVLIVDDNAEFQRAARYLAQLHHCEASQALTLRDARRLTQDQHFDLTMIDLNLPDGNGLELLDEINANAHGTIAIVTGCPSVESAARAVNSPVGLYLVKPLGPDVMIKLLEAAHARAQLRLLGRTAPNLGEMVGHTPVMHDMFEHIRRVAPLDVNVLMCGESGTGKELVARAIHRLSGRQGEFVPVNCGAITSELAGSQLFGHERGSFTGALQMHAGYFEQAQGGTLFLDEITEMPLALQVYLLRALESRQLTRIGGSSQIPVDVRVIAATNIDPQRAIRAGTLRSDLYYRLVEFPLSVPALSKRSGDIPVLAQHFLDSLNARYGTRKVFSAQMQRELATRAWPGNVRELRHAVLRNYILANDDTIERHAELLPAHRADGNDFVNFHVGMSFDDIEHAMLLKTLAFHHNNKRQAALTLGITPKTIYNRLLRYRELGLIDDELVGEPEDGDRSES
jgi:DNA-binding NtrC family response regulator